jgi:hypothetical protein
MGKPDAKEIADVRRRARRPAADGMVEVMLTITLRGKMRIPALSAKTLREKNGGPCADYEVDLDWTEAMNLDAEIEMDS